MFIVYVCICFCSFVILLSDDDFSIMWTTIEVCFSLCIWTIVNYLGNLSCQIYHVTCGKEETCFRSFRTEYILSLLIVVTGWHYMAEASDVTTWVSRIPSSYCPLSHSKLTRHEMQNSCYIVRTGSSSRGSYINPIVELVVIYIHTYTFE